MVLRPIGSTGITKFLTTSAKSTGFLEQDKSEPNKKKKKEKI